MTERYGSGDDFLRVFNPSMQYHYCRHLERCFAGNAPTLRQVAEEYGERVAETWLEIQIQNLSEFAGCKDKMGVEAITETARQVMFNYKYLKVTELMVFMTLMKGGRFGVFYGSVDPMAILASLRKFVDVIRVSWLDSIEAKKRREEAVSARNNAITWKQWQEMKKKGEDGGNI